MTTITLPRAVVEQALKALEGAAECVQQNYLPDKCGHDWDEQIIALRAALAQQDQPQGCATEEECTYQPWCRIRGTCQRKQADPDISRCPRCGSAADNGHDRELPPNPYFCSRCMAQQTETVEPVAWRWGYRSVTTGEMDWRGYVEIAAHPNLRSPEIIIEPLYTAPPQRELVPLTEEEIYHATGHCGVSKYTAINIARVIEEASWEKNHG